MLAYAAHRRPHRQLSPTALALIIGVHAVALAALISSKMEVSGPPPVVHTRIDNIPLPTDPPPPPPPPPERQPVKDTPATQPSHITQPQPIVDLPAPGPIVDLGPPPTQNVPDIGAIIDTPLKGPVVQPVPPAVVRVAARFATPADLLRPPYPDSKRRLEEEATLRLRLSVDPRGRVTAVDPVGPADPEFLESARRHLIRNWRYKPATEDGRPVPTTVTVTLRFQLDDA